MPRIAIYLLAVLLLTASSLCAQRLVLIDQDGSGPGGSNQMAMMVLLRSEERRVGKECW